MQLNHKLMDNKFGWWMMILFKLCRKRVKTNKASNQNKSR